MVAFFIVIAFSVFFVVLATSLSYSVLRSEQAATTRREPHFYLPNDFFVALVLLTNFWLILLVILGCQELLPADRHLIIIVVSMLAPFLSWWRKKKVSAE